MAVVAGVDACKAGWLCLVLDGTAERISIHVLSKIDELLALNPRPRLVLVDIPIGLASIGARMCDEAARKKLGWPRRCSVFPAPIRPVLRAKDHAHACEIKRAADGRGMSIQAWGIVPKVREVDDFLRSARPIPGWIREVHPEVSFWAWNGERPMSHAKKSIDGKEERAKLIRNTFGTRCENLRATKAPGQFAKDDLHDAFAALWSAQRAHSGKSRTLPDLPPVDEFGLPMEIVV